MKYQFSLSLGLMTKGGYTTYGGMSTYCEGQEELLKEIRKHLPLDPGQKMEIEKVTEDASSA